ncbi:MAG: O-acetylhomoserine aminocarboxypropyltransferase/cysteine synthase [Ruminococcaceae bacterium]|nr:O-acetylhomoserine aminocarboxypropyltransferase/cysteine synthase [Oscillospiraceae bacterium]
MKKEFSPATQCIHSGYHPENGEPLALPIYQSTTYSYSSPTDIGKLFDLTADGHMYSRISNPTVACVEEKIAALEGGIAALGTSSGQAASFLSVANIASAGDHILVSSKIYGGTTNLFGVTLKRFGIDCTFFDQDISDDELKALIQPNTKLIFGETIANPALSVFDIERIAKVAHGAGIPLIIDNTFATGVLCRPIEYGADIVVLSTSKYMDGHAVQLGGCVVDSGNFDWTQNDKFQGLCTPDESYHGIVYTESFGKLAYITKMRVQLMRDFGVYPTAQAAFLLDLGIQTLDVRLKRHCENALAVAKFLEESGYAEYVNYPGLESDKYHSLALKYLEKGASGVVSFCIKGGREKAEKFMNALSFFVNAVHVATVHSCVLHPASSTHRQLSDEMLVKAGIDGGLIRISVGIEDIEDIIADLKQALAKAFED